MASENQPDSVSRRDFLRVGGLSVVGLSLAEGQGAAAESEKADRRSCIFLLMTGGPSQLETFDPKPDAPAHIRGPLKAISTALPGVAFSEALPKLAERADRFSVIRSMHHDAAPIHETGYQLLHTGRLLNGEEPPPSFGAVVSHQLGSRNAAPPYVVLPKRLSNTGVNMPRGDSAGVLGDEHDPFTPPVNGTADSRFPEFRCPDITFERAAIRRAYGESRFGDLCLHARQYVEAGARCVVVNLFDRLQDGLTFDCHGKSASTPGTLFDYRDTLGPRFDRAVAALLDDLSDRGMLDDTLVIATGEFGRTPKVNADGGRDHWPGVWSALVAGGGMEPGQIVGASDGTASEPKQTSVHPSELVAMIYGALGVAELETVAAQ